MIVALRERAEEVRQAELERVRTRLDALGPGERAAVEGITRGIIGKLLHEPSVALKEAAGSPRGERLVASLRDLFGLDDHELDLDVRVDRPQEGGDVLGLPAREGAAPRRGPQPGGGHSAPTTPGRR